MAIDNKESNKLIMECVNDFNFKSYEKNVIIIGKFDGVHKGHQYLIQTALKVARENNLKSILITFDENIFKNSYIMSFDEKIDYLARYNIDIVLKYNFSKISNLSAYEFVKLIIKENLNASYVIAGSDFCFGKDRTGNANLLKELGKKLGFETIILDKLIYNNIEVSSTYIRDLISKGDIKLANELMGHNFVIRGIVKEGNKIGRTIGFPTANLKLHGNKLVPPNGVYYSSVTIDNNKYYGLSNIGVKPTVSTNNEINVEMHIFDYSGDLYGKTVNIEIIDFIRPEKKFDSLEELVSQIKCDCAAVNSYNSSN